MKTNLKLIAVLAFFSQSTLAEPGLASPPSRATATQVQAMSKVITPGFYQSVDPLVDCQVDVEDHGGDGTSYKVTILPTQGDVGILAAVFNLTPGTLFASSIDKTSFTVQTLNAIQTLNLEPRGGSIVRLFVDHAQLINTAHAWSECKIKPNEEAK